MFSVTTTLHCINSGLIKISRMQPIAAIYRGISGMKLPESFLEPNAFNVRAGPICSPGGAPAFRGRSNSSVLSHPVRGVHHLGVEYGFMSATLDRSVAEKYSRGPADQPSLILEMKMGMVNRVRPMGRHLRPSCAILPPSSDRMFDFTLHGCE